MQNGSMFQAQVKYSPYFYLQIKVRSLSAEIVPCDVGACTCMPLIWCSLAWFCLCFVDLLYRGWPCSKDLTSTALGMAQDGLEMEVDALLRRKYEGVIRDIEIVEREDLDLVRPPPMFVCSGSGRSQPCLRCRQGH